MIRKKRALWLMLLIDDYFGINKHTEIKHLLTNEDKNFLRKCQNFYNSSFIINFFNKENYNYLIKFLKESTIEDSFDFICVDSPNFTTKPYMDFFNKDYKENVTYNKLSLYSASLIHFK